VDNFEVDTSLAFDKSKQAAIVGWALTDNAFFLQCSRTIKPEWFADPYLQKVYGAMLKIYEEFHRRPKALEIKNYRPFTQEDARSKQKIEDTIVNAVKMTKAYGLDMLKSEITNWMHCVIFMQGIQQAATLYNAKKVEEAWHTVEQASLLKLTAKFEDGVTQGFMPSSDRIIAEREERLKQAPLVLNYGTGLLDDTLSGIIPNDLIVVGAKTGAGKTQLAASIALHNAQSGFPVHYFALEAENNEIERRIKYGLISGRYYNDTEGQSDRRIISYTDWRMGKLEPLLGPIERKMEEQFKESVKNLNTLYRTSGDFDIKALEKGLLSVVAESRLIVIDHLHYIDTDDDENLGYKRTIKLIRDIVLRYGVPVIVIAHLRKTQGSRKDQPLISSIEDFHGTSDVPKIATTCIMMGPAFDHIGPQPWLWPTYIGVCKSRLDGSRTRYTGLTNYNARTSKYEGSYRIGRMIGQGREWEELFGTAIPDFAQCAEKELRTDQKLG
jgi:hypothetical protein